MLSKPNAHELTQLAQESGALVLRGPLQYLGPKTGDWEIGAAVLSDYLYELRDRDILLILAVVDGDPIHLCGVCGFVLSALGNPCPAALCLTRT